MAITLLAHAAAGSTDNTNVTTGAIDTTGATFLVVALGSHLPSTRPAISDSKGNTWTALTDHAIVAPRSTIFYVTNPVVGTGHTFTAGPLAASYPSIAAAAFSGVAISTPFDLENGATVNPGVSLATGSVTPSQDNELIIAALGIDVAATAYAVGSGLTIIDSVLGVSAQHYGVSLAYLVQGTAAAINPTWSWTSSVQAGVGIATFKAPGPDLVAMGLPLFFFLASAGAAITGSGGIAFVCAALAAAGDETFTATAAETFIGPALSATGAETFTGTAAETFTVASFASSATETFTGTVAVAFSGPALAASGLIVANFGTAAVTFSGPALAASGAETFSGTATETFTGAALASTGAETFTATGTETFGGPALAASGTQVSGFTGTGDVTFAVSATAASGLESFTGTAAEAFTAPALAATAAETFTGTGAFALTGPALAGAGLQGPTGTATVAFTGPAEAAAGAETFTATAAVAPAAAALAGTGAETFTSSGAVAITGPALAGAEDSSITGTGSVAVSGPAVSGAGAGAELQVFGGHKVSRARPVPWIRPITGRASVTIQGPAIEGYGSVGIVGVGAVAVGSGLEIQAEAVLEIRGAGGVGFTGQIAATVTVDNYARARAEEWRWTGEDGELLIAA